MPDNPLQQMQILDGTQVIKLKINGDEMNAESGYRLDSILTSFNNFEALVNKTYLHINERERFKKSDAEQISIRLLSIEEGSFLSKLNIIYNEILIPSLPLLIDNQELMWGAIKLSFDFIKAKTLAIKEGKEVMVTQTASEHGINVVNNSNGTVNITVNNGIPELSEKLRPEFHAITKSIDGDNVSGIEISELRGDIPLQTLSLTQDDHELFKKSTFTEDKEIEIIGKIIDGNYSYKNGKINIRESAAIPGGDYKFSVSNNLHAEEKWREMFLKEQSYYCKKRVEYDPSNQQFKIIEIIITDWDESNWDNNN